MPFIPQHVAWDIPYIPLDCPWDLVHLMGCLVGCQNLEQEKLKNIPLG